MSKDWIGDNKSAIRTLAASNHTDHERETHDYYATDPRAAMLLLELEPDLHNIWECASGGGHLANVFAKAGKLGRKSDLIDRTGDTEVLDFLSITNSQSQLTLFGNDIPIWHGSIVTNPPYKYAGRFIQTALSVVAEGELVCMFLPVRYLEGKERRTLFNSTPPYAVYVSSSRIPCAMNGEFDKMTGSAVSYCWMVWKKGYKGETRLRWFN